MQQVSASPVQEEKSSHESTEQETLVHGVEAPTTTDLDVQMESEAPPQTFESRPVEREPQIAPTLRADIDQTSGTYARRSENHTVAWRLEHRDYAEVTADNLVQPGHKAHNLALVVELHGYARTDNSFRTLHDSSMIGTIVDGQLLVNVGRLDQQIPRADERVTSANDGNTSTYAVISHG